MRPDTYLFSPTIIKKRRFIKQYLIWLAAAIAATTFSYTAPIKPEDKLISPIYTIEGRNVIKNNHSNISIVPGDSLVIREINIQNERRLRDAIAREKKKRTPPPQTETTDNQRLGMQQCRQSWAEDDCQKMAYIIQHESTWVVGILNSEGCGGLSQACPVSKMGEEYGTLEGEINWTMRQMVGYNRTDKKTGLRYTGISGAYQHKLDYNWW